MIALWIGLAAYLLMIAIVLTIIGCEHKWVEPWRKEDGSTTVRCRICKEEIFHEE